MSEQSLDVVDRDTGKPEITRGVTSGIRVTLQNRGAAVALNDGARLEIYLPDYFTAAELAAMSIALKDWNFVNDSGQLILGYAGVKPGIWQGSLVFDIANVSTDSAPAMGAVQINPRNMPGAGAQFSRPLPLVEPARQGNADLSEMLQISLDSRGEVYVSDRFDPLANTLFLNIKNVGRTAIYSGSGMPKGAEIAVSFTYGETAGALAPAATNAPLNQPLGSAWNIVPGISQDQTEGWVFSPPLGSDRQPVWRGTPQSVNRTLFGTGTNANVTFSLGNIIALTPVGHTQITVSLTGFQKSDSQVYDPLVRVLDISKLNPPPTRGLVNFFGTASPIIPITDKDAKISIPLRWAMAGVNQIQMFTGFPGVEPIGKTYARPPKPPEPLAYDTGEVVLPGTSVSAPVSITLQARDAQGAFLNALQYMVYLQMSVFVDPRDDKTYPIALFGNRFWMTRNLDHAEPGALNYNDDEKNARTFGKLYPPDARSLLNPPDGWRVSSMADWAQLIDEFGGADSAYSGMMVTGSGEFNGLLGGKYVPSGVTSSFTDLLVTGYYWDGSGTTYASLQSGMKRVSPGGATVPPHAAYSIRYVKDA